MRREGAWVHGRPSTPMVVGVMDGNALGDREKGELRRVLRWNPEEDQDQHRARRWIQQMKPKLLIGSPVCTFFGTVSTLNWDAMDQPTARKCWQSAIRALNFAISLYEEQVRCGRLFLHEHPTCASSWDQHRMRCLLAKPGIIRVDAERCALGLMTKTCGGEWTRVKKSTSFITNSPQLAAALDIQCEETAEGLEDGRRPRAADYPLALWRAIDRGLQGHLVQSAAERREGEHAMHAQPDDAMTMEIMDLLPCLWDER